MEAFMNGRRRLLATGAAALCSLAARSSFAVDCGTLPNSVVLTGSTAFQTAWGCGMAGMVNMLTDTGTYNRGPGSGTQQIIAKAIQVDATAFVGSLPTPSSSSDNMRNNVSAGMAGKTIGFLAADNYDKN